MLRGKGLLIFCMITTFALGIGVNLNKDGTICMVGESEGAATVIFRVATNNPKEHPTTYALDEFAKVLKQKTNGKVEVQVYADAQLGEALPATEQVQQGFLEFVRTGAGNMTPFAPLMEIFNVPFLFKSVDQFWKVMNGPIGMEIFRDLESKQLKGLVYYDAGARSFYNRLKAIRTLEDMKGMKVRITPSKVMNRTIQILGALPATTTFAEVYSALQMGVIDGAENSPISLLTMKHHEVAPYFSLDEHIRPPDMLIMSLKKWNEQTPEIQKAIIEAAKASQEFQIKAWADYEKRAMDELRAKGEKINDVDKEAFAKAIQPLIEELKPQFKGLIERIQAIK